MGIDSSIYNALGVRPKSMMDYQDEYARQDLQKQAIQQNALALQQGQMKADEYGRGLREQETVRNALLGLGAGATDEQRINALKGTATPTGFSQADMLEKALAERQKTAAVTGKDNAQAAGYKLDQTVKAHEFHVQKLSTVSTPQDALAWAQEGLQSGVFTPEQYQRGVQALQQAAQNPQTFAQWKQQAMQGGVSATEQLRAQALATQQAATLKETARGHDLTYKAAQEGHSVSRANNRDTISAENLRAGVAPGGGLDDNAERTAQAIAKGQLPPPTGMALLNPKNQRVLGRVMEINPDYDATTVTAKRAAATAFTTGKEGAALRSVATANAHLDQLGELVGALENRDTQAINRVSNWYKTNTGNPAPTNFDAVKNVIGQEVVKAIVAGGGGVGEREEAAKAFSTAKSPAQLTGVIQHYRMIMGAQQENLLQQRDAAGLPRSTLPNYSKPSEKPAASASTNAKGWALHQDAKGNKAYVSPDGKQFEEVR